MSLITSFNPAARAQKLTSALPLILLRGQKSVAYLPYPDRPDEFLQRPPHIAKSPQKRHGRDSRPLRVERRRGAAGATDSAPAHPAGEHRDLQRRRRGRAGAGAASSSSLEISMLAGWVCWRRIGGPGGASSSLDAQRSTISAMALLWALSNVWGPLKKLVGPVRVRQVRDGLLTTQ